MTCLECVSILHQLNTDPDAIGLKNFCNRNCNLQTCRNIEHIYVDSELTEPSLDLNDSRFCNMEIVWISHLRFCFSVTLIKLYRKISRICFLKSFKNGMMVQFSEILLNQHEMQTPCSGINTKKEPCLFSFQNSKNKKGLRDASLSTRNCQTIHRKRL